MFFKKRMRKKRRTVSYWILRPVKQNERKKKKKKKNERNRYNTQAWKIVSNWILISSQPHRVVSGQMQERRTERKT